MTREEAIKIIDVGKNFAYDEKYVEAFDMAIEALKQDSILDKIRVEIEEYKSRQLALAIGVEDLEEGKQIALNHVLAIIDEYKTESEDM